MAGLMLTESFTALVAGAALAFVIGMTAIIGAALLMRALRVMIATFGVEL